MIIENIIKTHIEDLNIDVDDLNKCENCDNDHNGEYGSGRFCSVKCAKCFSTKAKRSLINEKISKTLKKTKKKTKKIKKCCSCNIILSDKTRAKYCVGCKKYSGYKTLFNKLNVLSDNLIISNNKAIKILYNDYFIKKDSKLVMMKKYNLMIYH